MLALAPTSALAASCSALPSKPAAVAVGVPLVDGRLRRILPALRLGFVERDDVVAGVLRDLEADRIAGIHRRAERARRLDAGVLRR